MTRLGEIIITATPLPPPVPGSEEGVRLFLDAIREAGLRRVFPPPPGGGVHPALELAARVRLMRSLQPQECHARSRPGALAPPRAPPAGFSASCNLSTSPT